jgi:hypothetical protein
LLFRLSRTTGTLSRTKEAEHHTTGTWQEQAKTSIYCVMIEAKASKSQVPFLEKSDHNKDTPHLNNNIR